MEVKEETSSQAHKICLCYFVTSQTETVWKPLPCSAVGALLMSRAQERDGAGRREAPIGAEEKRIEAA